MADKPYNRVTEGCALVGDLSIDGAAHKTLLIRVSSVGTSETDTGVDLPEKCLIHHVAVVVTAPTTGATKTLDVGLLATSSGGDADGFVDGVDVSSTGVKSPAVVVSTSGAAGRFVTGSTLGVFLAAVTSGSTAAADNGLFARKDYSINAGAARSVTITPGSSEWITFKALIVVDYTEID